jgi:hypothetical protein
VEEGRYRRRSRLGVVEELYPMPGRGLFVEGRRVLHVPASSPSKILSRIEALERSSSET